MQSKDLEVFNGMPFYFWVKDEAGRYVWVNQALAEMAQQSLIGKTDRDMGWAADAEGLRADDKKVLETGKTLYVHEYAHVPGRGQVTLNVCKFVGELDGKKGVFGVSFVID
jgi:two-component system aerobic respiration control sensor histidine kinase ArcB